MLWFSDILDIIEYLPCLVWDKSPST